MIELPVLPLPAYHHPQTGLLSLLRVAKEAPGPGHDDLLHSQADQWRSPGARPHVNDVKLPALLSCSSDTAHVVAEDVGILPTCTRARGRPCPGVRRSNTKPNSRRAFQATVVTLFVCFPPPPQVEASAPAWAAPARAILNARPACERGELTTLPSGAAVRSTLPFAACDMQAADGTTPSLRTLPSDPQACPRPCTSR